MKEKKNFWDRNAKRYDRFMRKDAAAYARMAELMGPAVRHRNVLELATGTGKIAKSIVCEADAIEATDVSPEMIAGEHIQQASFLRAGYVSLTLCGRQF